ncbi:copper resistance protein CopC [Microbacterium capsulatum]|uniref:Copper resistance protein CopC n=1 Tax=Microbacterium capsulatum TaxID=3041921 RepID=A0ABU0XMM0_9MICO|nr:copper resistance protein CopC [Microbacterium sp. ASV81]MDQ4215869.1 copper resistance protein CopC [Microbacterium sp. ASV81]
MRIRNRLVALAASVAAGLALAVAGASTASAHDTLEQSDPSANATVTHLDAVTLTFSGDPLNAAGTDIIQVIGPDKKYFETGCPDLNGPAVSSPVALGAAGTYEVLWRVVSSDGHPISGNYTFAYAPDGSASPAAAGSATPKCGPRADATPATRTEPMEVDDSTLWFGLGIGAVVLVAVGVGAWALARGRSPQA